MTIETTQNEAATEDNEVGGGFSQSALVNDRRNGYVTVPVERSQNHAVYSPNFMTISHSNIGNSPRIRVALMREERRNVDIILRVKPDLPDQKGRELLVLVEDAVLELDLSTAVSLLNLIGDRISRLPPEMLARAGIEAAADGERQVDAGEEGQADGRG